MKIKESLKPSYEGDKYANLVTAFAVIAAVEYSSDAPDLWDLMVGVVSIVLGVAFSKSENEANDFWYSFITASLISLGFVTIYSWCAHIIITAFSSNINTKPYYEIIRFGVFIFIAFYLSEKVFRENISFNKAIQIVKRLLCYFNRAITNLLQRTAKSRGH